MDNWKRWALEDKIRYCVEEFDGTFIAYGVVKEVESDHLIVEADGMNLWVDNDTAFMFKRV